jgi:hypothetical protein
VHVQLALLVRTHDERSAPRRVCLRRPIDLVSWSPWTCKCRQSAVHLIGAIWFLAAISKKSEILIRIEWGGGRRGGPTAAERLKLTCSRLLIHNRISQTYEPHRVVFLIPPWSPPPSWYQSVSSSDRPPGFDGQQQQPTK